MTDYRLIDQTPSIPAAELREAARAGRGALADFLGRARRLPTFSASYAYHRGGFGTPGDAALERALRALQGKFSVLNPSLVVAVPPCAATRVARLAHTVAARSARGDAVALALYEPRPAAVQHESHGAPTAEPARDVKFFTALRYRLVVATARADAVAAPGPGCLAVSRAVPWFDVALLTPDAEALQQMAPPTRHFYRHVTGRLGVPAADRYWYLDAWERFHEHGQIIGCILPSLVEHGHVGGAAAAHDAPRARSRSDDEFLFGAVSGYAESRWSELTPAFGRRGFVPPGYCLIRYACSLEIAVARPDAQTVAA